MYYMRNDWNTFKAVKNIEMYDEKTMSEINKMLIRASPHHTHDVTSVYLYGLSKEQIPKTQSITMFITQRIINMAKKMSAKYDWETSTIFKSKNSILSSPVKYFQFKENTVYNGYDIYPFALYSMPLDVGNIDRIPNIKKYPLVYNAVCERAKDYTDCNWGILGMSEYDQTGNLHLFMPYIANEYKNILDLYYLYSGVGYPAYGVEYLKTIVELAGKIMTLVEEDPDKYVADGYPDDFIVGCKSKRSRTVVTIGTRRYEHKSLMTMRKGHTRLLRAKRFKNGGCVPRLVSVRPTTVNYKTTVKKVDKHGA